MILVTAGVAVVIAVLAVLARIRATIRARIAVRTVVAGRARNRRRWLVRVRRVWRGKRRGRPETGRQEPDERRGSGEV